MASGIQPTDECLTAFADLKAGKLQYITFRLTKDRKEVEVEKKQEVQKGKANKEVYDEFVAEIKATGEPRFAVFDFEYDSGEGLRKRIAFINWIKDDMPVRLKMLYASSKDNIRKKLDGLQAELQCTDEDEIEYQTALEKSQKK